MAGMRTVTLLDSERVEYTTQLAVEVCCTCHVPFAMPKSMQDRARKDPSICFYCPNGHNQHYPGETEEDRLRKQLTASRRRAEMAEGTASQQRARAVTAERQASAYKGQATRLRKRTGNGVCPCCNRTFQQLTRHMASKHPGYAESPVK